MYENKKVEETIDKLYEIAKEDLEIRKKFSMMNDQEKMEYIKKLSKEKEEQIENPKKGM